MQSLKWWRTMRSDKEVFRVYCLVAGLDLIHAVSRAEVNDG